MADESGFEIGKAFVSVDPDAADFDEKLAEQIGSPVVIVRVQADAADVDAQIDEQVGHHSTTVTVDANTGPAREQVDELVSSGLPKDTSFTVGADTAPARGALSELDGAARDTQAEMEKLAAGSDAAGEALAGMAAGGREAGESLAASAGDIRAFSEEFAQADAEMREFSSTAGETVSGVDALNSAFAALGADLTSLHASGGATVAELAALQAQLGSVTAELDVMEGAFGTAATSIDEVAQAAGAAIGPLDVLNGDLAAGGSREASGGYADLSAELGRVGESGAVAASGVRATSEALAEANDSFTVTATELGQLDAKVGVLMPEVGELSAQFGRLAAELDDVNASGGADAAVLENLQMRITATGAALSELEAEIPAVLAEMDAMPASASAAAVSLSMMNREAGEAALANLGSEAEAGAAGVGALSAAGRDGADVFQMFSKAMSAVVLSPWTWAAVGAAAVAGLTYVMTTGTSELDEYTNALERQYHATGDNLTGYEAYNRAIQAGGPALKELATATEQVSPAMERFGTSAGSAAVQTHDLTEAQQQAAAQVDNLSGHLSTLEERYGLTQKQAEALAGAAHVSAGDLAESGSAAGQAMQKIEAYGNANEGARGKVSEMSNDMLTFGNDALTAKDRITGLDDAFNILVGNFVSSQQAQLQVQSDFLTIASNAKQLGASMTGTNQASVTLQQSFLSSIPDIEAAANAMLNNGASVQQVNQYLQEQADKLGIWTGSSKVATQALQDFKLWEDETHDSTGKLSAALQQATQTLQNQFIVQVKNAGVQSSVAKGDVDNLSTAIENTGTKSNATHDARAQLIQDLEQSGVKASTAKQDVDRYITSLGKIPSKEATSILVTGKGQWSVTESNIYPTPSGKAPPVPIGVIPPKGAAGMLVTGGTPGKDSVLISAMPGELVVPTQMVQGGAVDHLRGSIPGFASGGVVSGAGVSGNYGGNASGTGSWTDSESVATNNAVIYSVEKAMAAAINANIAAAKSTGAAGGPVGGDAAKNKSLGQQMVSAAGWGSQFGAFNNIAMAESGWNRTITNGGRPYNATTVAYGIPQALPASKMGAAANPPTSSASAQIGWMINYIRAEYGNPDNAWAFHMAHGYYDQGGWLGSGSSAVNQSGAPEAVLTPQESAAFVQLVKSLVGRGGAFGGGDMAGAGRDVTVNFNGITQAPTPEQMQAIRINLGAAIGVA